VDGLEEAGPAVGEARRGRQADPAGERSGQVAEDVAEHVLGEDDVELVGREDELHRRVVDEHVLELDVLVVGRDLVDDAPPHARGVEDIRLVHGHDPLAAAASELECPPGDPFDLVG
jgi:hypothetical protein